MASVSGRQGALKLQNPPYPSPCSPAPGPRFSGWILAAYLTLQGKDYALGVGIPAFRAALVHAGDAPRGPIAATPVAA